MIASELAALLRRYAPADDREAAFRERMLTLVEAPSPFARTSYVPGHFTASAFVLPPEEDALLLIFHKKLSLWLQPGGHVEPTDASVLAAARREVREEVGFEDVALVGEETGLFDIDIHPIPGRPGEPAHEHFDVRFLFRAPSRDFVETDEVAGTRWVALHELPATTGDESVLRAARKLRAR